MSVKFVWMCLECEHIFHSVKAAERAAFGNEGCPKCGSADIDMCAAKDKVRINQSAERERGAVLAQAGAM